MALVITEIERCGVISAACRRVGITDARLRQCRAAIPALNEAVLAAVEAAVDEVEEKVIKKAQSDDASDQHQQWFLQRRRRELYGDKVAIDLAAVTAEIDLSPERFAEREERVAQLLARAGVVMPKKEE